jgi:hypothetical protein
MSERMRIERIDDEGDRILFYGSQPDYGYGSWPGYHVIGSPQEAAHVKVGDVILYEPYGWNFGWFESVLAPADECGS